MAVERLLGTANLVSINTADAVAGNARQLGWNFSTNAAGKIVVAGYVKMNNAGTFDTGTKWQLWKRAAPISASTLIQNIEIGGGIVVGGAGTEQPVPGVASTALVQSDLYFVTIYHPSTEPSNYWFLAGFGDPVSGSLSGNCIFKEGNAATVPPDDETFTDGAFAVDIAIDDDAVTGVLVLDVAAVVAALDGELTASGVLSADVPAVIAASDGEVTVAGVLDATVPAVFSDIVGQLPVSGVLDLMLPELELDLDGNSAAGGATVDPCGWTIPAPICCPDWAGFSPAVQSSAQDYAATILWAATGRQFGLCEVAVRPCGMRRCQAGGEFFGYDWSGGTWVPYIFEGQWFNCACPGMCCCDPRCQVRLMGPVASIVEVTIGGIAVDPATYRVDDNHWLVRTGGQCWPECSDMDSDDGDNVLIVTYLRGTAVPASLLRAASMLACEWGKACVGADCRLSNRVTSAARQGITINMVDPGELLDSGMTGLWEVDTVIRAFNPDRLKQRLRVYAPELNVSRTVTSP